MEELMGMGVPLDSVAHIIQVALTPVFLLTGVSSLLNVINARLARVADQANEIRFRFVSGLEPDAVAQRMSYRRCLRRLRALDIARAFGGIAGACTCAATFALFLGALQNAAVATALFLLFGTAVLCTLGAMIGFLAEVALSGRHELPRDLPQDVRTPEG
jgi:hypothetical protein